MARPAKVRPTQITGTNGNDTLFGTGGNDIISGRGGNDDLFGGAGNDTFKFERERGSNHDTIHDWNIGDIINIPTHGYEATQVGDDVHITYRGGEIDVIGVNIADLNIV